MKENRRISAPQFRLKHVLLAVFWLSVSFALAALAVRMRAEQRSIGFALACTAFVVSFVAIGTLTWGAGLRMDALCDRFRFWLLALYVIYGVAWNACIVWFSRTAPTREVLGNAGYETAWKLNVCGGVAMGCIVYFIGLWFGRGLRRRAARTVTK